MDENPSSRSNALFVADIEDSTFLDLAQRSEHWNIVPVVLDFNDLNRAMDQLDRLAATHDIDFLLYSQNDQVGKRAGIGRVHQQLGLGYSSISAIDRGDDALRKVQTQTCWEDFLSCNRSFPFEESPTLIPRVDPGGSGSFSLVFDTEQLGGVRYGLPRLLSLLSRHGIRATFFVTNLVGRVYKNLFPLLSELGHELAPHGLFHEHLAPHDIEGQVTLLRAMIGSLDHQPAGANFIFRMNQDTVTALIRTGIRYFVYFDTNYFRLLSYPKRPTQPTLLENEEGHIWAIPIPVQTYGLPWFSIRNMLETSIMQSRRCGFEHVSVLMHPFRDGNLQNIENVERIIQLLVGRGMRPVTLADLESKLQTTGGFARARCCPATMIHEKKPPVALPSTRWDFLGFVPQTTFSLIRRFTNKSLF